MNKVVVTVVAIMMAVSVASMAFAAGEKASGQVVSVDPSAKTLVIKEQGLLGKEMSFRVADEAASTLTGIAPGDNVTVQYTQDSGQMIAQAIQKSEAGRPRQSGE